MKHAIALLLATALAAPAASAAHQVRTATVLDVREPHEIAGHERFGVDGLLAEKPAVGLTRAGETRRFVDMDDGEVLSFGPRTPAVLDALARAIYAP